MNDKNWKDMNDEPMDLHILFIEGFCQVPWFQNKFWTCPETIGVRPFDGSTIFRVWCGDPSHLDEGDISPDAYGMTECISQIECGKYHAIVIVDYSNNEQVDQFDECLGPHLQKFVSAGGVIAFPSSESLLLSSLQKWFDVEWARSDYYRTTWSPCEENMDKIQYSFGNGNLARRMIQPYSAKGNTLKSVPIHERCFGVGPDSKTQSLVPMMSGRDVSKESNSDDYDVIVAMHDYGKGTIAYFGDVNAETETLWHVSAFVESRSPKLPIDIFSQLSEEEFVEVGNLKDSGNHEFGLSNLDQAEAFYKSALAIFRSRLGSNGVQRDTFVALLSNLSLVFLKKKDYHNAEKVAGRGLEAEWGHAKCSYRRALARYQISVSTSGGDLPRIRGAMKDILNGDVGDATRKLLLRIEHEQKRLEKREQQHFSSGFASAISGVL